MTSNNITPYQNINQILLLMSNNLSDIFKKNLIGFYLFGSLTYGDFNPDTSDIDLLVIIRRPMNANEMEQVKKLHKKVEERYPIWKKRLECSYVPINMFKNKLPPKEPRSYYNEGIFYDEAPYGNEWIINNYLLYQHGIALIGKDFKKLIEPIDIVEVQKACIRDLFQEWEPKIQDGTWLDSSYHQSYLVMNLSRIIYTVITSETGTKKASAEWAKNQYSSQWGHLIEEALHWKHGQELNIKKEAIDFIKFVIDQVKKSELYRITANKKSPFVIFLTGASGAGKTTLINAFNHSLYDQSITCLHFDSIGVPSVEEMIKVYGSPSEWQKAMTYHWVQKIIHDYQDKSLVIIEGQVNLDYIVNAFAGFNSQQYKIILVHCNNATRHQRLHLDRNQPELINDDMDKWAEFLTKQAIDKNVTILDTSLMDTNEMLNVFKEYITKEKFNE